MVQDHCEEELFKEIIAKYLDNIKYYIITQFNIQNYSNF